MRFKDYNRAKELKELAAFLKEQNIEFNDNDLNILLEAGWWDGAKKAMRTGALLGASVAAMAPNWKDQSAKPYSFSGSKMYVNQQHDADRDADERYVAAGGRKFNQTLEDSQSFLKYRNTPEHKMALQKAGLPRNYIPTVLRNFVYGEKISASSEVSEQHVRTIEGEVKRVFGKDSFVNIVSAEDTVTGGKQILVRITGTVIALDENDAVKRAENVIRQIAKDKGYDITGFRDERPDNKDIEVKQAPRGTMDYTAESAGRPTKFSVLVKFLIKNSP
jgi:hypothetical protein